MSPAFALLGAGEFEPWAEEVDRWLIESSANGSDRVLLLPTASAPEGDGVFRRWAELGTEHYRRIGASPEVLPLKSREDAFRPELVDRVAGAAAVFFSGGNPAHLARVLAATPFWEALTAAVRETTSFGGCSAGVGFLGPLTVDTEVALSGRPLREAWTHGLGFFPQALFGLHWNAVESWRPGARQSILDSVPPGCWFVGIDESTAITGDGRRWTVRGLMTVTVRAPGGEETIYPSGAGFELDLVREAGR